MVCACVQKVLAEHRYEYVLERACIQFEPDDPNYIRVWSADSFIDDDDDDEGRINFSVALSSKTTRTRNNKLETVKSRNSSQCNETLVVVSAMRRS